MTTYDGSLTPSSPATAVKAAKEPKESRLSKPLPAAIFMLAVVAVLYIVELVDQTSSLKLDQYGIEAQHVEGLAGIPAAPFLHANWSHLNSNAIPLFVLGWLTLVGGVGRFFIVTVVTIITSGIAAWGLTFPANGQIVYVVGASGVITGWLVYLLFRGIFTKNIGQIVISVVVLLLYGSVLFGVFPHSAGVSWQAHLGGAIGGLLCAWLLRNRGPKPAKKPAPLTT